MIGDVENLLQEGAAFVAVVEDESREPVGLLQLLAFNPYDGVAEFVVLSFGPRLVNSRAMVEGIVLFLDEAFLRLPLRKVAVSLSTYALSLFGDVWRFFSPEGVLRKHLFVNGQYQDVHIGGLMFDEFAEHVLELRWVSENPDVYLKSSLNIAQPLDQTVGSEHDGNLLECLEAQTDRDGTLAWDSLGLLEVLDNLEQLAGRGIAVEALLACSTPQAVIKLAEQIKTLR